MLGKIHQPSAIPPVNASMLYDLVYCPHRVWMDLFADPKDRDDVSPFVQLLWERGTAHEDQVIAGISGTFVDLSHYHGDERERETIAAMNQGRPLIYSGRITYGDLLGEPDLLRRDGTGYIAGDIKSGAGEEGATDESDGKPKKHYAVQLALYTDILERLGRSGGRRAFVWDVHGSEILYDFATNDDAGRHQQLWSYYQQCLDQARAIISSSFTTAPAYASGTCKNCFWYTACIRSLEATNDLTLIPELGRTKRDTMMGRVHSIRELATASVEDFIDGKKTLFPGIGISTLEKFHARAKLLTAGAMPYLREPIVLPPPDRELFFDIEVDPLRDICYLHGFIERRAGDNTTERYVFFFTEGPTPEAEERCFAEAFRYLQAVHPCIVYYYSKYERTIYRKLQRRYPHVCTEADLVYIFDKSRAVDLYFDVILKSTEWPTRDYSIKTIAKYLGFEWNDPHPSGAASIEWFDRWLKQRDPSVRKKILIYNEDDCRATRVLLDAIRRLPLSREREA